MYCYGVFMEVINQIKFGCVTKGRKKRNELVSRFYLI